MTMSKTRYLSAVFALVTVQQIACQQAFALDLLKSAAKKPDIKTLTTIINLESLGTQESLRQALSLSDQLASTGGDFAANHLELSRIYQKLGEDDKAILAYFETLLMTGGVGEEAHASRLALGELYMKRGSYDEAGGQLKKALETSPSDNNCRGNLGICLMQLGYTPLAEAEFKKVLTTEPDNFVCLYNLGLTLSLRKDFERAASYFHKACEVGEKLKAPLLPMAYLGLSHCYEVRGQHLSALKFAEKAGQLAPSSHYVYLSLASIYDGMKEPGKAIAAVRKAIEMSPRDPGCQAALTEIINRQKKLISVKASKPETTN